MPADSLDVCVTLLWPRLAGASAPESLISAIAAVSASYIQNSKEEGSVIVHPNVLIRDSMQDSLFFWKVVLLIVVAEFNAWFTLRRGFVEKFAANFGAWFPAIISMAMWWWNGSTSFNAENLCTLEDIVMMPAMRSCEFLPS